MMTASEPLSLGKRGPNGAPHPFEFFNLLNRLDGRPQFNFVTRAT
jgi:hypothetical protein